MSKRKESEVWVHYSIIDETPHLAKCCLCSTKISRGKVDGPKKSYSVKGLWDHLSAKHKDEYKVVKAAQEDYAAKKQKLDNEAVASKTRLYQLEQSQPSLQEFITRNSKWGNDSTNQLEAERLLLNWIFDDLHPYTIVENEQFQKLLTTLNKKFNVPSEKVIRCTLMPKLYHETQAALLQSLSAAITNTYFSITCDIWSSLALDSYLGVTVHYISEDFYRKVVMVRCLPYNAKHTGDSIKERIRYILEKWQLPEARLHCVVSDTASNMKKAFEEFGWTGCFLHILALIVKHSIFTQSGVKLVLTKVTKLIIKLRTPTGINYKSKIAENKINFILFIIFYL